VADAKDDRWHRADESVATRFLLSWNATTSRWGMLGDVVMASACMAVGGFFLALAAHFKLVVLAWALGAVTAAPMVACIVVNVSLLGARGKVVKWLASQPFAVENMNAILAGFGEEFEIHFAGVAPKREAVMEYLARVSDDVFVLEEHEEQAMVLARLGVIGNKHIPFRHAHVRYERFLQVVERSLGPMHEHHPIKRVLVV
jgi:hypothetical protein